MNFTPSPEAFSTQRLAAVPSPLRLRTLIRLRWLAVVGQTAAVLGVSLGLGYKLPLSLCLAAIALSAWVNVFLAWRWRPPRVLSSRMAGQLLAYDIVQLAVLLYLTGGLENPFAFLFLVPVTVSATTLTLRWTVALALLAMAFVTLLAFYHLPLPWRDGENFQLPAIYVGGLWAAIFCATAFAALYARRIAEEARLMASALSATETVLAREQRLTALDGLAAAAAHELGTPLATIALVAKELKREFPENTPHAEDIDLLISQAARCREILSRLANREQAADEVFGQMKISALLEDLVAPLRGSDVEVEIDCAVEAKVKADASQEPVVRRNPAVSYGLSNILANAFDFAEKHVTVKARWSAHTVTITVQDDGPGFDQEIFDRLGDPFVTTRPGYEGDSEEDATRPEGMGLGLFIAKTLLERAGASVTLSNRKSPAHGATVILQWPRAVFDVGVTPSKNLDPAASGLQVQANHYDRESH